MYITVIDHTAVYVAIPRKEGKEYRLTRRLDNGYINGTQLLIARNIETKSERNMILSFEMSRYRMLNKDSGLFGTWILTRRARELAAKCTIQLALGAFLDEDIQSLFPVQVATNNKSKVRHSSSNMSHLAALRNPVVPETVAASTTLLLSNQSGPVNNDDPLLTHPNKKIKTAHKPTKMKSPSSAALMITRNLVNKQKEDGDVDIGGTDHEDDLLWCYYLNNNNIFALNIT